jgi:hypothetical protein
MVGCGLSVVLTLMVVTMGRTVSLLPFSGSDPNSVKLGIQTFQSSIPSTASTT